MILILAVSLAIFVAGCVGLGSWTQRWIGGPALRFDALAPLTGCAAVIWISALMNAADLFHIGALIAVVLAGCAALAIAQRGARIAISPDQSIPAAVVAGALVLVLFIPPEINLNDDGPAYLLFSNKLAALGSSDPEPFSERRLYSLGGQFGLVALVQSLFGLRWLSVYEPGLGLALIAGVVWLRARAEPLKAALQLFAVLGLAVISLTVGARPTANLAPALLYCALLVGCAASWLRLIARESADTAGRTDLILLALFCATALSLRPTALPFIALLAISAAGYALRRGRWLDLPIAVGAAAVVLAPSMIASFEASGTPMYPFLGNGVHNVSVGLPAVPAEILHTAFANLAGALLLFLVVLTGALLGFGSRRLKGALLLTAITIIAYVCVAWATDGVKLSRYSFPFVFAVLTALVMEAREPRSSRLGRPAPRAAVLAGGGAIAVVLTVFALPFTERLAMTRAPASLAARWTQPVFNPAVEQDWRRAQRSVPEGARILSIGGRYTALMDLRRNPVLAADQPATAGPGGWPTAPGSPKSYFTAQGVDYVLIDAGFMAARPAIDTAWRRRLAASTTLAQTQVLSATSGIRPIYADADLSIYRTADLNP